VTLDLQGADLAGISLPQVFFDSVDLRGTHLRHANFKRALFVRCNFAGANLRHALLRGATFQSCNCVSADLSLSKLLSAQFHDTDLSKADLSAAVLINTVFGPCLARHADFSHTTLWGTVFAGVDLREARGLDICDFRGPCVVGSRTLEMSGPLPLSFLRGCGVSEPLIKYLRSQDAPLSESESYFISYATANQDFADRLYADLQNNGVRCWFAPHHMRPGRKLHDQIDEAIRVYDRLLLILSKESMTSEGVATEIAKARGKEASQNRQVLFPISIVPYGQLRDWELFDADRGKDSAREIREYFIPDFSQWKDHDSYQAALGKLLKALKNAEPSVGAV
jgi:uncharacterized protein YjbI with pentapeptide repeats